MRTPKRPVRHKPVLTVQQATDAVDLGRLDGFAHSEWRQNRWDPLRNHRFPRARRSDAKDIRTYLSPLRRSRLNLILLQYRTRPRLRRSLGSSATHRSTSKSERDRLAAFPTLFGFPCSHGISERNPTRTVETTLPPSGSRWTSRSRS